MNNSTEVIVRSALDYLANSAIGLRLIQNIITIVVLAGVIVYYLVEAIKRHADFLRWWRWGMVSFLVLCLLSLIPGTYYFFLRSMGITNMDLRNLTTVTSGITPMFLTLVFATATIIIYLSNRRK